MSKLRTYTVRVPEFFYKVSTALAVLTAVVMVVHIVANVISRSFFNHPISGTNEFVTYWYMPSLALIGFMLAEGKQDHTKTRILFDKLPNRVRREVEVAGQFIIVSAFLLFGWYSLGEALKGQQMGATGGVAGLTIWPIMFLAPLAFFAMAVQITARAVASRTLRRDQEGG